MQTQAFDYFSREWRHFVETSNFLGRTFESEVELLIATINIAQEFMKEKNSYTKTLSNNESKYIRDLLFAMGCLLRLQDDSENLNYSHASEKLSCFVAMSRKQKAPTYTFFTGGLERMCGAEPKVLPQDLKTVVQEMNPSKKRPDEAFLESLEEFMSNIDSFAAQNARIEVRIPPQKPFNNDTLRVFQEVLGVLHNSEDNESLREQSRIERFLKTLGVTILWPREDEIKETAEFFVVFIPNGKEVKVVKPYLKFEDIVFRGEIIMPA